MTMDRMIPTSRDMGFEDPPVPEKPVDVALFEADRIATALESIAKSLEKFVKIALEDGEFGVTTYPGKWPKQ